ncbi:3-deoxy-D-manno-octulosonate 8-phosphate phosphatase (KDO 8-P phosphatase) [Desulfocicer vacuolatum DSM 3385]|uniref:3-deoxy-D-manno-octulosonate 8-phosphate phosphatase KdsC n=2 Tax=Desulfocicer vacuolatum TaxID=2298 RepID=A0A1W2CEG2_9BACT|nr:HAD-IIIA family hydrolase [Desulfocicer vacuolatum]SMC83593.1 3-deoxy-D-manno-octulosonate 8-phosphate phosphatase (KDO 8-P phosphatase) [Desulfocicer vacuolatum DSM 3385]
MPTDKMADIQLLLLDVDGVLTDGSVIYADTGAEIKTFNVRDGLGLRLLMKAGVQVGIITGRQSRALDMRCRDLGIDLVFQGVKDKLRVFNTILAKTKISAGLTAFMGDDLPDLSVYNAVGLFLTVSDAPFDLLSRAHGITTAGGGHGAVREVCEEILKAKGLWEKTVQGFLT